MNTAKHIMAASVIVIFGSASALAYDQSQYDAVTGGKSDCAWCDLSGADLRDIDFSGADLSGANLTGADISGAILRKADLSGADLTGAVVAGADLSDSSLAGADLDQVDLSGALLSGAVIEKAYCDWATKLPDDSEMACIGVTIERK
jgi:uncharacterized protein YjbI with pentapeptide repeats